MTNSPLLIILINLAIITTVTIILKKFLPSKLKCILSKIVISAFIIYFFVKMFNHNSNSIINGMICIGISWGLVPVSFSKSIGTSIVHMVISMLVAWVISFIIAIIDISNNNFASMIRMVSLIGLGVAEICSVFGKGLFLSLESDPDSIYNSDWSFKTSPDKKTKKTLFELSTIMDSKGNTTTVTKVNYTDNFSSVNLRDDETGKETTYYKHKL